MRRADAGLSRERTRLAWSRCSLSLLATAALALRTALQHGRPILGCLVASAVAAVALASRAHASAAYAGGDVGFRRRSLIAARLAAATTGVAVLACAFVIT